MSNSALDAPRPIALRTYRPSLEDPTKRREQRDKRTEVGARFYPSTGQPKTIADFRYVTRRQRRDTARVGARAEKRLRRRRELDEAGRREVA